MTEENRRLNVATEWEMSDSAWAEAELLLGGRAWRGAVSRYYYAAFHGARAALLSRGLEPATHAGLANRFAEIFVRNGILEPRLSRVLGRLQRDREQADYSRSVIFQENDALAARQEVNDFREALRELLSTEGWFLAE